MPREPADLGAATTGRRGRRGVRPPAVAEGAR